MDIRDKIIVITGASSGLGKETAINLSRHGGRVVLVARSATRLKQVQDEITEITGQPPVTVQCDITREEDISIMVDTIRQKYDHIDILINNAGIAKYLVSEKISNQEMRQLFKVNFFGTYYCIKALLPLMKHKGKGYILNVSSLFGLVVPFADISIYSASKFAIVGFSEGLRKELKSYGIGVGLFMPGSINTPFQNKKEEGERKTPPFLMMDVSKAAKNIINMITKNKKNVVTPRWMLPLFKAIALFS